MGLHVLTGLAPQLTVDDLPRFRGHAVLGESLEVLMSAALRLRFVPAAEAMAFVASMPRVEVDAVVRAMDRVDLPPGSRPEGHDDAVRLGVVLRLTGREAHAVVAQILAEPA